MVGRQSLDNIWIYIDESGVPNVAETSPVSIGSYTCTAAVPDDFFQSALDTLPRDDAARNRGWFHASQDSPAAHSAECGRIGGIPWKCAFDRDDLDKGLYSAQSKDHSEQFVHRELVTIAQMHGAHFARSVHIHIAERAKSFTQFHGTQLESFLVDSALHWQIDYPLIPMDVPEYDIRVVDGSHPGIQVVDFLLWASLRAKAWRSPCRGGRQSSCL